MRDAVTEYRSKVDALAKETPYGVPYKPDIWGAGWNIQRFGWDQWMLHLSFPDLFPRTYALQALSFILGVHPGSNTASFVSGVGAKSLTTAYGYNRADWSHIPGGSASGTALIRPDFPELKHWPFFWQQTEYVLGPRHDGLSTAGAGRRPRAERAGRVSNRCGSSHAAHLLLAAVRRAREAARRRWSIITSIC